MFNFFDCCNSDSLFILLGNLYLAKLIDYDTLEKISYSRGLDLC